jgi:hypothetical protein
MFQNFMSSVSNQFPGSEDFDIRDSPSNLHPQTLRHFSKPPRATLEEEIPHPEQQIKRSLLVPNKPAKGVRTKRYRSLGGSLERPRRRKR